MSAEDVLAACRDKEWTIATAESCTGGLVAAALTDIPGSSDVVDRGYVTYSNIAKMQMLGVDPVTLQDRGAVSEQVARQMANGARVESGADLTIAVTGIAGPGGTDRKPEGMVCFAIATAGKPTQSETVQFGALGRADVRAASVKHALELLLKAARA